MDSVEARPIAGTEGTSVGGFFGSAYMLAAPPHTPTFSYSVWVMPEDGGVVLHRTLDLVQRGKSMFDGELLPDGGLAVSIGELELFYTDPGIAGSSSSPATSC